LLAKTVPQVGYSSDSSHINKPDTDALGGMSSPFQTPLTTPAMDKDDKDDATAALFSKGTRQTPFRKAKAGKGTVASSATTSSRHPKRSRSSRVVPASDGDDEDDEHDDKRKKVDGKEKETNGKNKNRLPAPDMLLLTGLQIKSTDIKPLKDVDSVEVSDSHVTLKLFSADGASAVHQYKVGDKKVVSCCMSQVLVHLLTITRICRLRLNIISFEEFRPTWNGCIRMVNPFIRWPTQNPSNMYRLHRNSLSPTLKHFVKLSLVRFKIYFVTDTLS
jgi:hypothetical protein